MNLSVTDPAILFPGISLLFLAYTNRYLTLAQVVRSLTSPTNTLDVSSRKAQISNLYLRIALIKYMQANGIVSFLLCLGSMVSLLQQMQALGEYLFLASLGFMALSLVLALLEILRSGVSLRLELKRFEGDS